MNPLGINLSFAVKRWPEPDIWAQMVREELELDLVQFSFDLLDPWWPSELSMPLARRVRKAVEANDLSLHSAFVGLSAYTYNALCHPEAEGRKAATQWFKRAIDISAEMGAEAVGGPVGGMSVEATNHLDRVEASYRNLLNGLVELTNHAKEQGLKRIYIEPTPLAREVPWTVEGAKQLTQDLAGRATVPIAYTIDLGHALYKPLYGEGASLEPWFQGLGDQIGLIHLQQTDGLSDSHWGFTREGIVDPHEVARQAAAAGLADVPMLLEVFYPFELDDREVLNDIRASVRLCKEALRRKDTR